MIFLINMIIKMKNVIHPKNLTKILVQNFLFCNFAAA